MLQRILGKLNHCYQKIWIFGYRNENKISTYLSTEEKYGLFRLAEACNGETYVEIGSYVGASSCFIAAAIRKHPGRKLYCVDTWQNDAMTEGKQETFEQFTHNTKKYERLIMPLRGQSEDIAKNFDKKIDFLFIDGDHSYEGVRTDVDAWLPKLRSNGVVVFHDTWAEGVQQVVQEHIKPFARKDGQVRFLYWAWLA